MFLFLHIAIRQSMIDIVGVESFRPRKRAFVGARGYNMEKAPAEMAKPAACEVLQSGNLRAQSARRRQSVSSMPHMEAACSYIFLLTSIL